MTRHIKRLTGLGVCIIIVFMIFVYFSWTATPLYDGRLVIDFCNNTRNTIDNAVVSFEKSDDVVNIPVIQPQERVVLLIPSKIFDTPTRTEVFINYNNKKYTLMSEYHSVNGGKYNKDVRQAAKVSFWNNQIRIYEFDGAFDIIHSLNLKPYSQIIDLDF